MVPWAWGLLVACARCRQEPDLPDTPQDSARSDTDVVGQPTDTALPHCGAVHAEPDGPAAALDLPLETVGCGAFGAPLDADWWRVVAPEAGWLLLRVDARRIGSRADPDLVLLIDDIPVAVQRDSSTSEDIALRVPHAGGPITLLVTEGTGAGDAEDFAYEVLASATKPPVDAWDLDEVEPNDATGSAQGFAAASSVIVLAASDAPGDVDRWRVDVPAGEKGALAVRVLAAAEGAPGDYAFDVHDAGGQLRASATGGAADDPRDPIAVLDADGGDSLEIAVRESTGAGGPMWWYVLQVRWTAE